jgi:hypothetical protein
MFVPASDDGTTADEVASVEAVLSPVPLGVPVNVYELLDGQVLDDVGKQLEAEPDLGSFLTWLDRCVEGGAMTAIVADHIAKWNQLKASTDDYMVEYQAYVLKRLHEWNARGLTPPSTTMFGSSQPALSTKQPRNAPCRCSSGLKYKRCHGS